MFQRLPVGFVSGDSYIHRCLNKIIFKGGKVSELSRAALVSKGVHWAWLGGRAWSAASSAQLVQQEGKGEVPGGPVYKGVPCGSPPCGCRRTTNQTSRRRIKALIDIVGKFCVIALFVYLLHRIFFCIELLIWKLISFLWTNLPSQKIYQSFALIVISIFFSVLFLVEAENKCFRPGESEQKEEKSLELGGMGWPVTRMSKPHFVCLFCWYLHSIY